MLLLCKAFERENPNKEFPKRKQVCKYGDDEITDLFRERCTNQVYTFASISLYVV